MPICDFWGNDPSPKNWWLYVYRVVCSIPYYLLRSAGFIIIFPLWFLLLVAYIFSFFFGSLTRGIPILVIFWKEPDFFWLVFAWHTFFFLLVLTYLYHHYIWSQLLINCIELGHVLFIHSDSFSWYVLTIYIYWHIDMFGFKSAMLLLAFYLFPLLFASVLPFLHSWIILTVLIFHLNLPLFFFSLYLFVYVLVITLGFTIYISYFSKPT